MKKCCIWLLLITHLGGSLVAQHENDKWMFGQYAGVDFTGGTTTPVTHEMITQSACASVASPLTGELLFYTNGITIWNKNHVIMPNGTGLLGDDLGSASQGALIVPFVNDTSRYYVFYTREEPAADGFTLHYAIVDMSLDSGNGDVVTGEKNIALGDTGCAPSLMAISGTTCNTWLVTHLKDINIFQVFEMTESGINTTPVLSTTGAFFGTYAYRTGTIKASPDGLTIGVTNFTISVGVTNEIYSCIELYDFDPATGIVSNSRIVDQTVEFFQNFLSFDFSPDGSKLYATNPFMALLSGGEASVSQYDLSLPNLAAIQASKIGIANPVLSSDIRWAPDGKVYVLSGFGTQALSLDVIDAPNLAGVDCQYNEGAVALSPDVFGTTYFPTRITYPHRDTIYQTVDTFICNGQVLNFTAPAGYLYYTWQGEALSQLGTQISTPGTYTLTYSSHCQYVEQTITVTGVAFTDALNDTALCGEVFEHILDAGSLNPPGTEFTWQDGSTEPVYVATQAGTYWVEMMQHGCLETDSAIISSIVVPEVELGKDTVICENLPLLLEGPLADTYLWQDGSMQRTYSVQSTGTYVLTVTVDGCEAHDEIAVVANDCSCHFFAPNAFSPNNDGLNDHFTPILACGPTAHTYELSIYNRWGERVYYTVDPSQGWDGRQHGTAADVGTYFYRVSFGSANANDQQTRDGTLLLVR